MAFGLKQMKEIKTLIKEIDEKIKECRPKASEGHVELLKKLAQKFHSVGVKFKIASVGDLFNRKYNAKYNLAQSLFSTETKLSEYAEKLVKLQQGEKVVEERTRQNGFVD